MNCKNCNDQVPHGAKFCTKCGKAIEVEVEIKNELAKPKNNLLEMVCGHLQFLGFNIEFVPEKESQKEFAIAKHSQKYTTIVNILTPKIIYLRISLTTNKKPIPSADIFMNNANLKMACTKVYYDVEEEMMVLRFEAFYVGEYSKENFGEFFSVMERDITLFSNLENHKELFTDDVK